METQLTAGVIPKICSGELGQETVQPILQVIDIRLVQNKDSASERYRIMLSDGEVKQQGMLATQKNDLVRSRQFQKGSVVQLIEYVVNSVRDRMLIIVIDVNVIVEQCDIIGVPNTVRSPAPMQFINQASTTISGQQSFTNSVSRPNPTTNSLSYPPPQQQQNTSVHSFGIRPPANSYMRPVQPTYNQPRPMYVNRGPASRNESLPKIVPIAALNQYQGMWTIKVRVTAKAEVRHYKNSKGDGKVFSFDLLDSDGGEIRTTCFNAVVDQFYDQIEVGNVYLISKGSVKQAQKAFNHLKNEYELFLDSTSTIQPLDDDRSIQQQQYHFREIAELGSLNNNTILDIIGVVFQISPSTSVAKKDGTITQKRTLHIKDMSSNSVEVTLWGNFCNREGLELQNLCDSGVFPILAMKAARVSDFNGKTVGTISTSQLSINPDIPRAQELRIWFDTTGKNDSCVSLSIRSQAADAWKTISQIKDDNLGSSGKPDWITVSATIPVLKLEHFCYPACPLTRDDRQCMKKVTNNGDGNWHCDTCDKTSNQCDYRYILSFQIQDHTGMAYVTAFQEPAEMIMGVSANELNYIKHGKQDDGRVEESLLQDDERLAEIVKNVVHTKYNFKLKVKEEMYQEETRVKLTVVKAERIGFSSDTKHLLDLILKEVPSFVVPKIETPNGFQQSARFSNSYMGSVAKFPPANQMVKNVNHYGGSRIVSSRNSYGDVGHNSVNLPTVVSASGGGFNSVTSGGRTDECYKCHQSGHWARDCPSVQNGSSMNANGNVGSGRYGNHAGYFFGN